MTHIYYIHFLHGNLYAEAFGDKSNSSVILIGAEKKSIWWNNTFCHALTKGNDDVAQFDHRYTGLSTHINAQIISYGLQDLARDVLRIFDCYEKSTALFITEKVLTFVLLMTIRDARLIEHKRFDVNGKEITPLWFIQSQVSRVVRMASHNPHWVPNTIQKLSLTNGATLIVHKTC